MTENERKILNLLGIARRAGVIFIGQDQVLESCKKYKALLVLTSDDCSENVLKSLKNAETRTSVEKIRLNLDRTQMGQSVGTKSAQIVSIDYENGFAGKILSLMNRSDADE